MRAFRSTLLVTLLIGILGPGLPTLWCSGFSLFRNSWGDVIVSTDTTLEGHALTPPAPEKPVYYLGRSLGNRLGSVPGDQEPSEREMNHFVAKVLAKQGYLGASPGVHEPALYLVVQWGYLKPGNVDLLWFLGYDSRQDIASPSFPGLLGAEVFRRDFRSHLTETILQNARDAIYGVIVTAFEYKSANTPKPVIYWQTRIGLPATGKSMTQALPTMLLAASTAIGHEGDKPVLVDADNARAGGVRLGELQILDVINEPLHIPNSDAKK